MIESILEYLANNSPGSWAGPILGLIAFVETLFPPLPGDILFIVISGWAIAGGFSLVMAVVYGVTGCFMASCILFYLGHKPGKQFLEGWLKKRVEPEKVNKAKALIAKANERMRHDEFSRLVREEEEKREESREAQSARQKIRHENERPLIQKRNDYLNREAQALNKKYPTWNNSKSRIALRLEKDLLKRPEFKNCLIKYGSIRKLINI